MAYKSIDAKHIPNLINNGALKQALEMSGRNLDKLYAGGDGI